MCSINQCNQSQPLSGQSNRSILDSTRGGIPPPSNTSRYAPCAFHAENKINNRAENATSNAFTGRWNILGRGPKMGRKRPFTKRIPSPAEAFAVRGGLRRQLDSYQNSCRTQFWCRFTFSKFVLVMLMHFSTRKLRTV